MNIGPTGEVLMNQEDESRPDRDEPDDPPPDGAERSGAGPLPGLALPQGFARSLMPNLDAATHSIAESIIAQWRESFAEQMQGFVKAAMPTFNYPMPALFPGLS